MTVVKGPLAGVPQPELLPLPEYLTVPDLSQLIDLVPGTLAKKRWDGTGIPFSVIGNRILYAREDVLAYVAARRVKSTAEAQAKGLMPTPKNKKATGA